MTPGPGAFAVLVACNQAHDKACNDAVLALIADHFQGERSAIVGPDWLPPNAVNRRGE